MAVVGPLRESQASAIPDSSWISVSGAAGFNKGRHGLSEAELQAGAAENALLWLAPPMAAFGVEVGGCRGCPRREERKGPQDHVPVRVVAAPMSVEALKNERANEDRAIARSEEYG